MLLDTETRTYERHRADLLASDPGKFVLIAGETIEGIFETHREAMTAGYQRFGVKPFLVKQILATEPVLHLALR